MLKAKARIVQYGYGSKMSKEADARDSLEWDHRRIAVFLFL
jgi:hypothetical protein